MNLPSNIKLPYFAYGLFKPDELAYNQIKNFVERFSEETFFDGALKVRDGLPLLLQVKGSQVRGYLIHFKEEHFRKAYERISEFEPEKHYRWEECDLSEPSTRVNILIGKSPQKGSLEYEGNGWRGRDDPLFNEALVVIGDVVNQFAQKEFESEPSEHFDWARFFKLQMAYQLLWSSIERYCSLAYGPKLKPIDKLNKFAGDDVFKTALKNAVNRDGVIFDSRDPKTNYKLDPDNPVSSIKYYYGVRSNLSHRGKGTWKDGNIILSSLKEMHEIFQRVVNEKIFKQENDLVTS